jgi:hypothetical protein
MTNCVRNRRRAMALRGYRFAVSGTGTKSPGMNL